MADKKLSKEEIIEGFNKLRQEQRAIASKIAELEADKSEHGLVLNALHDVDGERKCFRLIGGVLVERTVNEVLPALTKNKEHIVQTLNVLNESLKSKGKALNDYREKHNITVRGENQSNSASSPAKQDLKPNQASGVLVQNSQ